MTYVYAFVLLVSGLGALLIGFKLLSDNIEKLANSGIKKLFNKIGKSKLVGVGIGAGVTAIIQSSGATTIMIIGFVNAGIMTLSQATCMIMGANIGTTITAQIVALEALDISKFFMLFSVIGIFMAMLCKKDKVKTVGLALAGLGLVFISLDFMSSAMDVFKESEKVVDLLSKCNNPFLLLIIGIVFTALIQSSSATTTILIQMVSAGIAIGTSSNAVYYVVLGSNIGTCVTALLSSIGTNKNARRAAFVHLMFNVVGTIMCLSVFSIVKYTIAPSILNKSASMMGIALCHSMFNIICVIILLPMSSLLEKLAYKAIPGDKVKEKTSDLDERLFVTPALALAQSRDYLLDMSNASKASILKSLKSIFNYSNELYEDIEKNEKKADKYEDEIGTYLVKLGSKNTLNEKESEEVSRYLKVIGDFERISDHGINVVGLVKELRDKNLSLSEDALKEMEVLTKAIDEIVNLAYKAFKDNDLDLALKVGPLEEVVDELKETLRSNHINRVQKGKCTVEAGFIWSDLLTNLERVSDHCNNIAIELINGEQFDNMRLHKTKRHMIDNKEYEEDYKDYLNKYSVV